MLAAEKGYSGVAYILIQLRDVYCTFSQPVIDAFSTASIEMVGLCD